MATSAPFLLHESLATMSLPITSITALLAGAIILLLTIKVIQLRRRDGVILGDNADRAMAKAIRGQANATEQIPIALILMGLAEAQGGSGLLLTTAAITLIVGRILHGVYFSHHGTPWQLRFYGMLLTLIAQILLLVTLLMALVA